MSHREEISSRGVRSHVVSGIAFGLGDLAAILAARLGRTMRAVAALLVLAAAMMATARYL